MRTAILVLASLFFMAGAAACCFGAAPLLARSFSDAALVGVALLNVAFIAVCCSFGLLAWAYADR